MPKIIAIIQTGKPIQSVLDKYGNFDQWFTNGMDISASQTQTFHVYQHAIFPRINNLAGVIITGSPSMVTEQEAWSEQTIEWLKQFKSLNIPVLGVCYGHQLLVTMLGGTVKYNPNGRQIGQVNMNLTQAATQDALFSPLLHEKQSSLNVLATHQQSVTCLPKDVTLLGATELDPFHCFRYKNHIWGLQFHPEFTNEIIKGYIHARSNDLIQEGLNPRHLKEAITDGACGRLILQQFKTICQ